VEFRASWLKGLGQRIPLRIPLKPRTWFPDHSMIWAAQYRPFEGLPWSSWVKDSNIGLCVSRSWWRYTTKYVECWSVTQVLCIIFLYDQWNSGFLAHKISIIFSKNLCFLHASYRVQKARGSRSAVSYLAKIYAFKCVASRTKSKGLPFSSPLYSKNLCFLHA
jgi:hypothetical protein